MPRHAVLLVPLIVLASACSASEDSSAITDGGSDVVAGDTGAADGLDATKDSAIGSDSDSANPDTDTDTGVETAADSADSATDDSASPDGDGSLSETGDLDTGAGDTGAGDTDSGALDVGADGGDAGTGKCPPSKHLCVCATGFYCLPIGYTCLAPTAPCP